jgi:hypothetical protein
MGRKAFKDFIQVRNLQNGAWVDGKLVSVNFDLIIGPISFIRNSLHVMSGSIRFRRCAGVNIKTSYVHIVRELVRAEIKKRQQKAEIY